MCISLSNTEYSEYNFFPTDEHENPEAWFADDLKKPYVGHLIYKTIQFRNGPEDFEMGLLEKGCRRVIVGELFFAALIVATLVENVARVALCLIAALPSLCCEPGIFDEVMKIMVGALITTPDFITRCFFGIVMNPFFGDNMTFEDLSLCKNNNEKYTEL